MFTNCLSLFNPYTEKEDVYMSLIDEINGTKTCKLQNRLENIKMFFNYNNCEF